MQTFKVTTLADSGAGSLRAAIEAVNACPSGTPAVIKIQVRGTIQLDSDLPSLTHNDAIDTLSTEISGTGWCSKARHTTIKCSTVTSARMFWETTPWATPRGGMLLGDAANNNTIGPRNLVSGNTGTGIRLDGQASDNQIVDNRIGFDASGEPLLPNTGEPIALSGAAGNTTSGNEAVVVRRWPESP